MKTNLEDHISDNLAKILKNYTFNVVNNNLQPEFSELIELYLNDKNSSTMRQYLTANVCGYKNSFKKLGYDAIDDHGHHKEIKPTNRNMDAKIKYSGSFGFSDYTAERFNNDVANDVHVLQSFFVEGKLVYIIEFPISDLKERMDYLIDKIIKKRNQRYIRSATFTFCNLTEENVIVKYVAPNIDIYENCMIKKLFTFIKSHGPVV